MTVAMAGYNISRAVADLLAENEQAPSSFTVNLYPEHWTLNQGSKFLYNNPVASLLDDIRAQRIPVDLLETFDSAGVPFYDGCMIVDLLDYRPLKHTEPVLETPERSRVVLQPNPESLWADLCLLNDKLGGQWTDQEALQLEAQLLLATTPPLCLDPDPHLARIANNVHRAAAPSAPPSLKRKADALEEEQDETERARRMKILQYMDPKRSRAQIPSNRILNIEKARALVEDAKRQQAASKQASQTQPVSILPGQIPMAPPSRPPSTINGPAIGSANTGVQPASASQSPIKATNGLPVRTQSNPSTHYPTPPPPVGSPFNSNVPTGPAPAPAAAAAAVRAPTEPSRTTSPAGQVPPAAVPSRPPSSQRITQQQPTQPQVQQYPSAADPSSNQPFQPQIPGANFLRPPPTARRTGDDVLTPAMAAQPLAAAQPTVQPAAGRAPTPAQPSLAQIQNMTAQQRAMYVHAHAQNRQQVIRMQQTLQASQAQQSQQPQQPQPPQQAAHLGQIPGRSTPQMPQVASAPGSAQKPSPVPNHAQQLAAAAASNGVGRASPLVVGQPPTQSRSPMPNHAQIQAIVHQHIASMPLAMQPQYRQQLQQASQTNPAHYQAMLGAAVRYHQGQHLAQQQVQQQQAQQQAVAAMAAQTKQMQTGMAQPSIGQVPHMVGQFQPVYNYAQMGMNAAVNVQGARMPAGYAAWPMNRAGMTNLQQQQAQHQAQQQAQHQAQQIAAMQLIPQPPGQAGGMPQR